MNRSFFNCITTEVLTFSAGQRLAYNNTTGIINIVDRNNPLEDHWSTSLTLISEKVRQVTDSAEFSRLNAVRKNLVSHNISQINNALTRYNQKIESNPLIKLIDRIIVFFTCYKHTLKYRLFPIPNIPNALQEFTIGLYSLNHVSLLLENARKDIPLPLSQSELLACALPHIKDLDAQNMHYVMEKLVELDNGAWTNLIRLSNNFTLFDLYLYIWNQPNPNFLNVRQRLLAHLLTGFIQVYLRNPATFIEYKIRLIELLTKEYQIPANKVLFGLPQTLAIFELLAEITTPQKQILFEMMNGLDEQDWSNLILSNSEKAVALYRELLKVRNPTHAERTLLAKLFDSFMGGNKSTDWNNSQLNSFQTKIVPFLSEIIVAESMNAGHKKRLLNAPQLILKFCESNLNEEGQKILFDILTCVAESNESWSLFQRTATNQQIVKIYEQVLNNPVLHNGPLNNALFNLILDPNSRISGPQKMGEFITREYAIPEHKSFVLNSVKLMAYVFDFKNLSKAEKNAYLKIINDVAANEELWNQITANISKEQFFPIYLFILQEARTYCSTPLHQKLFTFLITNAENYKNLDIFHQVILIEAKSNTNGIILLRDHLDIIVVSIEYLINKNATDENLFSILNGFSEDLWQKLLSKLSLQTLQKTHLALANNRLASQSPILHERLFALFLKDESNNKENQEILSLELRFSAHADLLLNSKKHLLEIANLVISKLQINKHDDEALKLRKLVSKQILTFLANENSSSYFIKMHALLKENTGLNVTQDLKVIFNELPLATRVSLIYSLINNINQAYIPFVSLTIFEALMERFSKMDSKELDANDEELKAFFALAIKLDKISMISEKEVFRKFIKYLVKPSTLIHFKSDYKSSDINAILKKALLLIKNSVKTLHKDHCHPLRIIELLFNFQGYYPEQNGIYEIIRTDLGHLYKDFEKYLAKHKVQDKPLGYVLFYCTFAKVQELDLEEQDRFFDLMISQQQFEFTFAHPLCNEILNKKLLYKYTDPFTKQTHKVCYRYFVLLRFFEYLGRTKNNNSPKLFNDVMNVFPKTDMRESLAPLFALPLLKFLANFELTIRTNVSGVFALLGEKQVDAMFKCLVDLPPLELNGSNLSLIATHLCQYMGKMHSDELTLQQIKGILAKIQEK